MKDLPDAITPELIKRTPIEKIRIYDINLIKYWESLNLQDLVGGMIRTFPELNPQVTNKYLDEAMSYLFDIYVYLRFVVGYSSQVADGKIWALLDNILENANMSDDRVIASPELVNRTLIIDNYTYSPNLIVIYLQILDIYRRLTQTKAVITHSYYKSVMINSILQLLSQSVNRTSHDFKDYVATEHTSDVHIDGDLARKEEPNDDITNIFKAMSKKAIIDKEANSLTFRMDQALYPDKGNPHPSVAIYSIYNLLISLKNFIYIDKDTLNNNLVDIIHDPHEAEALLNYIVAFLKNLNNLKSSRLRSISNFTFRVKRVTEENAKTDIEKLQFTMHGSYVALQIETDLGLDNASFGAMVQYIQIFDNGHLVLPSKRIQYANEERFEKWLLSIQKSLVEEANAIANAIASGNMSGEG